MFDEFVDVRRIERRLDELWNIGKSEKGGVTRLAYSEEESEAIDLVLEELPTSYDVRTDEIGNVFATRQPDAGQSLYLGSHLDSVFNGGRLDGTLGVITAFEAIEAVHASEIEPAIPPTLVIFRGEESSRFGQHTIGSRGALGLLTVEDFSATDQSDIPLWQAMQEAGLQPTNLSQPTLDLEGIAGFLEAHIEQGRVLDDANDSVGVVTGIRAPVRYRVRYRGEYDHSGATPMDLRHDALAAGAEAISSIEEISREAAEHGDFVSTVGDITAVEGAINKVCGEVEFPIDIRSNNLDYRDQIENRIVECLDAIAARRKIVSDRELLDRSEPVELDQTMVETLAAAADTLDVDYRRLPSGGGHDAMNFQRAGIPTGMLFAPSIDGVSHNPNEDTPSTAIEDIAVVLAQTLATYEP